MKKIGRNKQQSIIGGAYHYHWKCNINDFWSVKYNTYKGAYNALGNHLTRFPGHDYASSIVQCSGTSCR